MATLVSRTYLAPVVGIDPLTMVIDGRPHLPARFFVEDAGEMEQIVDRGSMRSGFDKPMDELQSTLLELGREAVQVAQDLVFHSGIDHRRLLSKDNTL
jgi:hypothetical protein